MRRRRTRAEGETAEVQIPIPAMLDMTFQLLSFFILTFNPPHAGEGQMDMMLPAVGAARPKDAEQADPFALSSADAETPADVVISVSSTDGSIGNIIIKEREQVVPVADVRELRDKLKALRQALGPANIKVEANCRLKYAGLVEIMDAGLAAKFQTVGFMPPPDLGKSK